MRRTEREIELQGRLDRMGQTLEQARTDKMAAVNARIKMARHAEEANRGRDWMHQQYAELMAGIDLECAEAWVAQGFGEREGIYDG